MWITTDDICRRFIQEVHNIIDKKGIQIKNIINMDQVPRYFKTEPKSTITTKGSCEVLMRKGGTSHKRFTVTFAITANGVMLRPHILFCGLNNKPAVLIDILVDVNKTGMWNDDILLDFTKNVILSRQETAFYCDLDLYVIDSYGVHLNLAKSKILEKHNVFVAIIPPNMTNILQPLDVAINRSYQEYYQICCDGYIAQALEDTCLQTKAGNPKVPSYMAVSN
jgi:DDE superfamily endonuclease